MEITGALSKASYFAAKVEPYWAAIAIASRSPTIPWPRTNHRGHHRQDHPTPRAWANQSHS